MPRLAVPESQTTTGVARRLDRAALLAGGGACVFLVLASWWVRSLMIVDDVTARIWPSLRVDFSSASGRVAMSTERSVGGIAAGYGVADRPLWTHYSSHATPYTRPRVALPGFRAGWGGFGLDFENRGFAVAFPLWMPVLLTGVLTGYFSQIWWRRRTGRRW